MADSREAAIARIREAIQDVLYSARDDSRSVRPAYTLLVVRIRDAQRSCDVLSFSRAAEIERLAAALCEPGDLHDESYSARFQDAFARLEQQQRELRTIALSGCDDPAEPEAVETSAVPIGDQPAKPTGDSTSTKTKRSTERGEGRAKLIAALTKYHEYADGGCLKLESVGNNELARLAGVSDSTASAFFNKEFDGHAKYRAICADATRLVAALKLLNGEFAPHLLYGSKPADEGEREDEE